MIRLLSPTTPPQKYSPPSEYALLLLNWCLALMPTLYARWMDRWERKLATRDTNRVVRPFDWGSDWLHSLEFPGFPLAVNGDAAGQLAQFARAAVAESDRFYAYPAVSDFGLRDGRLTFTSAVLSPYPENDTVHAVWSPAPDDQGRALIVLPQ